MHATFFLLSSLLWAGPQWWAAPTAPEDPAYFAAVATRDVALRPPRPGEWRYEHPEEPGQTLAQYQQLRPVRPDSARQTIYLLTLGSFTPLQRRALAATGQYLEAFFQQRVVLLPDTVPVNVPPAARRRNDGHAQWLAPYLIEQHLQHRVPADGLALMAFCAQDLYPRPDWNYVFGLAYYPDHVGVTSLFRLQNERLTAANYQQCLRRLILLSSHELGHMFSLRHCLHARCAMNGTNSLPETDAAPNRLCSECQTKLYWNCRYDNRRRLQQLLGFFKAQKLRRDYALARQDWRSVARPVKGVR